MMENTGVPTPRMDWDSSNVPDAWRKFRQHIELMFSGPLRAKEEEGKCSYLLLWIGEKGRDIFNTWTLTADQRKVLTTYYDGFEAYVMPKANPIFARYKFHEKMQGESLDQFATELKLLVKDCNYPNSDEMVRDRIVFAINSPRVREKVLSHGPDLTLEKTIDIARSHELSQHQLKTMCSLQLKPSATPVACPPRRIPYALRSQLKEELDEMERMDIIQKVTEPTEYRFNRLPLGIMSAQDEFQRRIDETYEGLSGVAVIADDILVYGRSKEEHDASLRAMLTREGIRPDPNKIKAIKEMEPPRSKAELDTILAMVTYLSRFAPKLSEATAPLHQLLKEPGPVLTYFSHTKDVKLQGDASKCGLGAVLLREEKPVACASKTLNGTEQNYAQIEKETVPPIPVWTTGDR
ncbi:hypothetical protein SKAU_G00424420 [Synaphobranchus kaupii]|uniref:Reverse transcriptase/retrotransposon-derived protein RNase H-like domain-containing protein n=1 Tax=Synaphobranchus kaupii TaxID=118154 RepID=A0A9Q1I8R6_SYNKA|nr:hypothetical protein SKAU_G00424420 [Synaphobranchus kaupii]